MKYSLPFLSFRYLSVSLLVIEAIDKQKIVSVETYRP